MHAIGGQKMNYLKIYVVSPLTESPGPVGAAIRYVTDLPKPYKLPEYGSTVLRIDQISTTTISNRRCRCRCRPAMSNTFSTTTAMLSNASGAAGSWYSGSATGSASPNSFAYQ